MIAGILLAAGRSRRFGGTKLLQVWGGKPLIHYALRACLDSRLGDIRVVVDARAVDVESALAQVVSDENRVVIVRNTNAARGLMSSVKAGIQSVPPHCNGAAIVLADMPRISHGLIDTLIDHFERHDAITIPECQGRSYHPRIIPRRYFSEFLTLPDDAAGMSVIDRHEDNTLRVCVGTAVDYADVDTPEDLDALS